MLVDPYSSGRFLVDELLKRQWPLIAVRSSLTIDEALLSSWNPSTFLHVVVHHGDLAETASSLRAFGPIRAVIAGSEPGVALTDELTFTLDLRGNVPGKPRPRCRWDKYEMHERLSECGVRALRQRLCVSAEDATIFAAEVGQWPIVVKPPSSHGGGGGVHLCGDLDALHQAVAFVRASKNFAGRAHDTALAQEYLQGREFVVDCVSLDGEHLVSATWAYRKTPTDCGVMYDHTRTLPYDSDPESLQQRVYRYVFECLTALGVRNGASHCEVVVPDADDEHPCLVRLGARMHGSMGPALWARCTCREQAQPYLLAELYTEQDGGVLRRRLREVASHPTSALPYELKRWSVQVDLQCPYAGVLDQSVESSSLAWLKQLPCFSSLRMFVEEGDYVPATSSLSTSPGFVLLFGDSEALVDRDVARIREREAGGQMYLMRSEAAPRRQSFDADHGRRNSISAARLREFEAEADKLVSPLVSRAASPVLSPQQAPQLPPDMALGDVEFMLGGDDLDDFDFLGGSPLGHELDGGLPSPSPDAPPHGTGHGLTDFLAPPAGRWA